MNKVDWSQWNSTRDNFKQYSHIKSVLVYGKESKDPGVVSIVILTYKRAGGLKAALESALNQDFPEKYSIAVLDDSEFDKDTDDLMKRYCKKYGNILYYRHEKNLGQYANWNRACELSPTEWYCLLHDDDILKNNYLSEVFKYTSPQLKLGLMGVYIDVNDTRDNANEQQTQFTRKLFNRVIATFLSARRGKAINLQLRDNVKHIYVMNSTFINKYRALEIGGLDDRYYPSSDFAFSAKMAYFYKTAFLPIKLTNKGVGDSESLKQSVCDDSIRCAFYQTLEMSRSLGDSKSVQNRKASIAAVISELGVRGYNDVDYSKVKLGLGMNRIYNNHFVIFLINIYSKFNWGLLLFRKSLTSSE